MGKYEAMRVSTSVGRFTIVERLADGCTSGSHKGLSPSDGETGKLPEQTKVHPGY